MPYFSMFAIYFIVWWITLFACLPIGLKTQAEAGEIVPGSTESAPHKFQAKKVLLLTTVVSALICGAWWLAVEKFGFGLDSLPQIGPASRG
jgi:predicted secreted protein